MEANEKLTKAFEAFDAYHAMDPNKEIVDGKEYPKELVYAIHMSNRLDSFAPEAAEYVHLAARCQHIGRWEVPRSDYPMDRKGYLQWRNLLKQRHAELAEKILAGVGYDAHTIDIVKFLILKKQLHANPDTQLLEDIVCLVFVEHYIDEFAARHPDDKVTDILKKTLKKMSPRAVKQAGTLVKSEKIRKLLAKALEE